MNYIEVDWVETPDIIYDTAFDYNTYIIDSDFYDNDNNINSMMDKLTKGLNLIDYLDPYFYREFVPFYSWKVSPDDVDELSDDECMYELEVLIKTHREFVCWIIFKCLWLDENKYLEKILSAVNYDILIGEYTDIIYPKDHKELARCLLDGHNFYKITLLDNNKVWLGEVEDYYPKGLSTDYIKEYILPEFDLEDDDFEIIDNTGLVDL